MNKVDLGLVRGTMWYAGKTITGNSSKPATFPESGIQKAYPNDKYLNVNSGYVYECVTPGTPEVATWTFIGNIRGPQPGISNTLSSTSSTIALSANMGRKLNEKINSAGLYPFVVYPDITKRVYLVTLEIENKESSVFIVDEDGNEGMYYAGSSEVGESQTISIPINNVIGMPEFGAIIKEIRTDNAAIYSYAFYDENTQLIDQARLNLWQAILDQNIDRKGAFVEDDILYYTAQLQKKVDGVIKELYPVGHDLAIWHDKSKNELLHNVIETNKADIIENTNKIITLDGRVTVNEEDIDELQREMDGVPGLIQEALNEINLLKGKIIDSLTGIVENVEAEYFTGALATKQLYNEISVRFNNVTAFLECLVNGEWIPVMSLAFLINNTGVLYSAGKKAENFGGFVDKIIATQVIKYTEGASSLHWASRIGGTSTVAKQQNTYITDQEKPFDYDIRYNKLKIEFGITNGSKTYQTRNSEKHEQEWVYQDASIIFRVIDAVTKDVVSEYNSADELKIVYALQQVTITLDLPVNPYLIEVAYTCNQRGNQYVTQFATACSADIYTLQLIRG